jgi:TolA-binding protein
VTSFISFAARYWKEILIGLLLLIVSASWYYDRSSLIKAMDSATSRYEQELVLLRESHAREIERKEELVREHEEKIQQLQVVFDENQQEIEELKSDRIVEVTTLRRTNPEVVAEQIQNAFGFDHVE